jgi:hypothetical protein
MSYVARFAAIVLVFAVACSSSKPPEGKAAEVPVAAAEPPAEVNGATPPASDDPAPAAPPATPAPPEAPEVVTLFVSDRPAECQAEGAQKCLMIRGSEGEQWRRFYGTIEGFEYEPSFTYELRVEVTDVVNPLPDAPSIHYKLVEVVAKRKTTP